MSRPGPRGRPSLDSGDQPGYRWLLIRRSLTGGQLAYYRCYAGHIPLTRTEIARLLAALAIQPGRSTSHCLHWSR